MLLSFVCLIPGAALIPDYINVEPGGIVIALGLIAPFGILWVGAIVGLYRPFYYLDLTGFVMTHRVYESRSFKQLEQICTAIEQARDFP